MENIWGPQRKTGNMEEESFREENRKAHEEDERFRTVSYTHLTLPTILRV